MFESLRRKGDAKPADRWSPDDLASRVSTLVQEAQAHIGQIEIADALEQQAKALRLNAAVHANLWPRSLAARGIHGCET